MPYEFVQTEARGRVGLVTLNRPGALNALNRQLIGELMQALEEFDRDAGTRALVVTGSEKAFAAGADIKEMAEKSVQQMRDLGLGSQFRRIMKIGKPIIAAVSGYALGGGCELALACDLIVASETARFGQPEVTIGVIPGVGGTQRLTRAVGKVIAMEMILNNRTLSAQEALQLGLVNRVVGVEAYLQEALKLAGEIGSRAPLAVKTAKSMINKAYELSLSEAIQLEAEEFSGLFATADQKEGMKAFIEKRAPSWRGR